MLEMSLLFFQHDASKTGGDGDDDENGDEDWGDDLSPAIAELNHQIKGMIQTDDLDKPLQDRCDQYSRLIEVNIQKKIYDKNNV